MLRWSCRVVSPRIAAKKKLRNASFSEKSDAFSLAIHIFRLLMDNADPFGFSLTDSAQMLSLSMVDSGNSIVNGECVYFRDILHKQISKWSPTLAILPEDIQALFQKTFDYTAETAIASAINRPTAAEWMAALRCVNRMSFICTCHPCPIARFAKNRIIAVNLNSERTFFNCGRCFQ